MFIIKLAGRVKCLGLKHPDTLASMNNLASLYYRTEKFELSESLYAQCYELRRELLGEMHPDTIASLSNLASVHYIEVSVSSLV